jgi:U3 small nucleolar RNA-associated protein 13
MTDLVSGLEICRFAGDTENITSLCISPSCRHLVVFTSSLSIRIYEIPGTSATHERPVQPIRVVAKAHDSPVHVSKVDPTSTYIASGSADGVVKVWDIVRGYITHIFRGHGGVVSALAFNYPHDSSSVLQTQKMQLITASVDTRIRIYDLTATANKVNGVAKPEAVLEGHVSVPRALDVTQDGKWLVSGGRDSVVLLWNLASTEVRSSSKKGKSKASAPALTKTIPVLERVEAVGFLRNDEDLAGSSSSPHLLRLYTGGQKGVVKIWDAKGGTVLFTLGKEEPNLSEDQEEQQQIVDCIYLPSQSSIVSVHADQNILFHSLSSQALTQQLIGFNDEIVDAVFLSAPAQGRSTTLERDTHVAFATNSSLIRVYSRTGLDARLLIWHRPK